MNKLTQNLCAFALLSGATLAMQIAVADPATPTVPAPLKLNFKAPTIIPSAPTIDADSYILIDVNSGKVLAASNPDMRHAPASLTKLMTMYIISSAIEQGQLKLSDQVNISKNAWQTGGSKMFVKVGESVPVRDLLQGIIVASGNDACVAMSEHIAGSEDSFSQLMNQQASILGMKGSHFVDSTGMPNPDHYTTARDMATLGRAIIRDFPHDYQWYKQKWFEHNGIKQPNRNRLLWRNPAVDGMKTGHTDDAGFCLVASAQQDGMRLLSVVLGAPNPGSRADSTQNLLTYGFRFFETQRLYKAGQAISTPHVWMGESSNVPVGVTDDLYITIPRNQFKNLVAHIDLPDQLHAPISKGQKLGTLTVKLQDKVVLSKPIYALADNNRGGLWTRVRDRVQLKIKQWLGSKDDLALQTK